MFRCVRWPVTLGSVPRLSIVIFLIKPRCSPHSRLPGWTGWRSGDEQGPYWGRMGRSDGYEQTRQGFMNFKLENVYVGAIPLLFAVLGLATAFGRRRGIDGPLADVQARAFCRAASTSWAWPSTLTPRHRCRMRPSGPMRKVERSMPRTGLPYIVLSLITP